MTDLVENTEWAQGIYQLETTDPVLGGPTGIMNQQAKQLAARTAYLRKIGMPEWDAKVAYPANAFVQDAGKTWKAKTASINKKPSTNAANWLEWGLDLDALTAKFAPLASPTFTGSPTTPTPPQFDNDQSIANMAALQAAGLHFQGKMGVGISGNVTLGLEHAGHWFEVKKAGAIVGLPSVAALPSGLLTYTFKSLVDWTLQAAAGETISAVGGVVKNTLVVKAGESLTVVCNGSGQPWYVVIAGFSLATLDTLLAARGSTSPGKLAYFAMATAPSGWLKANGAAVSRTTYAALFSAIGTTHGAGDGTKTFNLPDRRGEFLRGLDDGRGVDPGRAIGTWQAAAVANHTHQLTLTTGNAVANYLSSSQGPDGTLQFPLGRDVATSPSVSSTSISSNVGGAENRVRNFADLICIKY